jgi:hypothetical protein
MPSYLPFQLGGYTQRICSVAAINVRSSIREVRCRQLIMVSGAKSIALLRALIIVLFSLSIVSLNSCTRWEISSHALEQTGGLSSIKDNLSVGVDIRALTVKLEMGIETTYYQTNKIPESEIVEGKQGNYYFIDLKNVVTKEVLFFKPGKYTIDSLDREFSQSITSFYREVWNTLQKDERIEIFVLGSADVIGNESFRGTVEDVDCQSEDFLATSVFPRIDTNSNRYSRSSESQLMSGEYKNRDLPNLRARFVQCKLKEAYSDLNPKILQGSVSPEAGEHFRNVSLILFVPKL